MPRHHKWPMRILMKVSRHIWKPDNFEFGLVMKGVIMSSTVISSANDGIPGKNLTLSSSSRKPSSPNEPRFSRARSSWFSSRKLLHSAAIASSTAALSSERSELSSSMSVSPTGVASSSSSDRGAGSRSTSAAGGSVQSPGRSTLRTRPRSAETTVIFLSPFNLRRFSSCLRSKLTRHRAIVACMETWRVQRWTAQNPGKEDGCFSRLQWHNVLWTPSFYILYNIERPWLKTIRTNIPCTVIIIIWIWTATNTPIYGILVAHPDK